MRAAPQETRAWMLRWSLPVVVLVAGVLATERLVEQERTVQHERSERQTLQDLTDLRSRLETELNVALHLASGVEAFLVAKQGMLDCVELERALAVIHAKCDLIRNIGIAPDNTIQIVHPYAGNERALGLHYPDQPDQWPAVKRVIESGEPFLAGPLELVQGGQGLIFRHPVFLEDDGYWGMVSTVIDADALWERVEEQGAHLDPVEIRGADASGLNGPIIRAGAPAAANATTVTLEVPVPGGAWHLVQHVAPPGALAGRVAHIRGAGWTGTLWIAALIGAILVGSRRTARARDRAEAAGRARSDFLAMMSHEIRTPMNGVIGMTQLLVESGLEGEQADQASTALRCAESLMVVLDDILDFSKFESGALELEEIEFDVPSLLHEISALFEPNASKKGITLECEVVGELAPRRVGDPTRIRQILFNLAGNAIKFTEEGTVRVLARDVGEGEVEFVVEDTGVGISEEAIDHLFEPFRQADTSTSRRFGGTGLGLAICNRLTEAMRGRITIESNIGRGTTFRVTIPLESRSSEEPLPAALPSSVSVPASEEALEGRVLIVEDNPVNRRVATALLERMGLEALSAPSGGDALEVLAAERVDLVLMDMQMPGMDGPEATRRIRAQGSTALDPSVPILALTANVLEEHREECIAAGMDGFLAKPVRADALRAALAEYLAAGERTAA